MDRMQAMGNPGVSPHVLFKGRDAFQSGTWGRETTTKKADENSPF